MAPARTNLARKQNPGLLLGSPSFADTAGHSRSQPKMEDNLFTSPNIRNIRFFRRCLSGYTLPVAAPWFLTTAATREGTQRCSFNNLNYHTGTDRLTSLTNSKTKAFLHSDWRNNLNLHRYIVSRHTHLCTLAFPAH